jgi:hypothetical protein
MTGHLKADIPAPLTRAQIWNCPGGVLIYLAMVPLMFAALRQSKNSRELLSCTSKINNYSLLNENKTKPFLRSSRLFFNNIIE